jgi:putative two-component system response regulator
MSPDVTAKAEAARLRDALAEAQLDAIRELQESRLETVERLARAVELHDASTGAHVGRMAVIAAVLAQKYGLEPGRVELLRTAAPMHDVGKIGIGEELLRKPGKLTTDERAEMERHTLIGHQLLAESESELLNLAAMIALTHHEHFDGNGYPHGLAAEEIPLEGRLVAVADVFDALLSDRSYRPAMSVSEAVELIRDERGTHFDPRITDLLLANVQEFVTLRG